MKKVKQDDELKAEYTREELGVGVRGKYYQSYRESHNIVLLKPEVAKFFPTDEAVNDALLSLIRLAQVAVAASKSSDDHS